MEKRGDMGPFAGMDAALERAITSYGTPPYREMVTVKVRDVGHYSFDEMPTTIENWIEWLTEAREEVPEQYRHKLNCVLAWEAGYYDSGDSADFVISYERPETDEEMTARVNDGIEYVNGKAVAERREYDRLKAKFDATPTAHE